MKVVIEFLGMQRTSTGAERLEMPITAKTTVDDALEYARNKYPQLELDEGTVLVVVNQEVAAWDQVLKDKDTVHFLPFLGGG